MRKKVLMCIILIITILMAVGYIAHVSKKNHFIEVQKSRLDLYFKYNLRKYGSMKITKVQKNPMGDYLIKGYINNDKDYYFTAYCFYEHNFQFNGIIRYPQATLGKLFKEEEPKNKWKPDEIIKKEHLDKTKYEANPPMLVWF